VAAVNGETISKGQLDRELAGIQGRMARQGQPVPDGALAQIRGQVLDQMIGEELLFQESRKQKINVDDQKIQVQIDEMARSFEDKAAFDLALANAGLSREVLTERLRRQMAIQQLIEDKIVAGLEVVEARADEFYKANPEIFVQPEQVRARHILIRTEAEADAAAKAEARERIDEIRRKAVEGEDFAALAKTHSQDPGSKDNGGDLGFFARGQMVKPFEETAFALKENEISQVVESPFGFHIIQVTGRKPAETVAYETVKPRILEHLKQQAIREKLDAYVDGLRQGAKIEKFI
jgi:peptidyl-prolyl cis-trans isomerase C